MQEKESKKTLKQKFFDVSLLVYYVAYVFYYGDYTPYNGVIRDVATILLLLSGFLLIQGSWRYLRLTDHFKWYGLFILFSMLSFIWAKDPNLVISAFPTMFRLLVVGYFVYFRTNSEKDAEDVCDLIIIGALYACIAASYRMINRYSVATFYLYRIGDGVGSNSNTIAILALFIFFLAYHKYKINKLRVFNIILMIGSVLIIFFSQSKKAMFSFLIGIIIIAAIKKGSSVKKYTKLLAALLLVYVAYQAIMTIPSLYEMAGYRIDEMFATLGGNSLASHSTYQRQELIRQGIEMWKNHPILGVGLNNFSIIQTVEANYYSHNNYIEMLSCLGIVGFAIYYSFHLRLLFGSTDPANSESDLYITFKTLLVLVLLMDVALVSYETLQVQIILIVFSIIKNKKYRALGFEQ